MKKRGTSLSAIGILLYFGALYSIGTISSITSSWTITLIFLCGCASISFFLFMHKNCIMNRIAIAWLTIAAVCVVGTVRGFVETVFLFYILCGVIIISAPAFSNDAVMKAFNVIYIAGIINALACFWQYFFPSQYYNVLYPRFRPIYQQAIRRQFTFHKMCTGLTSQTAITVEFIILGIMALLYLYPIISRKRKLLKSIIAFLIMAGGILLTGKRSPIICIVVSFLFVDIITIKRNKILSRVISIVFSISALILLLYFIAPYFIGSRNSIVRFLEYSSTSDLEELSNGRFGIYRLAVQEFLSHPIMGIGWGRFKQIYGYSGAHNIYLQLLCECGIAGFVIVCACIIYVFYRTIVILKNTIRMKDMRAVAFMKYSLFIQTYILIYGIFGNPLYDQNYLLMYALSLILAVKTSSSMQFAKQRPGYLLQ